LDTKNGDKFSMVPKLDIESLADGIPVIDEEAVGFYKLNCMACFQSLDHASGVKLKVEYENVKKTFEVCWSGEMTSQQKRNYADLNRATDHAACAIALLLIRELTELTAIEQARIGTSVDYYLILKTQDKNLIVNQAAARLEISGILCQNENNSVDKRIREKLKRLKPDNLPAFIIIVEFSKPWVKIIKI
jgi:tRNA U34 5-carboxymethylaminomethyl modifying enzyme MnmG/GidA